MKPSIVTFALSLVTVVTSSGSATPIKNIRKAHAAEEKVSGEEYDYIIAGGGLAGTVLAERLTADGTKNVLVLEAGSADYKNKFINIPAGILRLFKSPFDWDYETKGEKACNGRNVYFARGKVLGGSSCLNVLLHHRGTNKDYDDWGVPGWGSADVLEYFKMSHDDLTNRDPAYHGKGGEWTMDEVKYQNPLSKKFLEVGAAAGLGTNDDFNNWGREQDGVGRFQVSAKKGARVSGASAFLSKAIKRKNLSVRTGTMVRRINFDSSKTSTGVTYDLIGDDTMKQFSPKLKKGGEILVTSGAIASPQLLMVSGIGPADHLEENGIKVIADLPGVGENLQDHPSAVVSFKTPKKGISVTSKLRIPGTTMTNPLHAFQWLLFGTGILTSVGCDHGAFTKTSAANGQSDLQVRFLPAKALSPDGMTTFSLFRTTPNLQDGYSFQSVAIRARSRGQVRLASSNTHVKPSINAGYLADTADMTTLREGIKLGRKLGNRDEWGNLKGEEVYPGAEVQTDDEIDEYIRNTVHTANAIVGTCKMGSDASSVVGPDLKVHGVGGVRVIDASIIPRIMGGQTGTPVVMIAERAAAFMKDPSLAPRNPVATIETAV